MGRVGMTALQIICSIFAFLLVLSLLASIIVVLWDDDYLYIPILIILISALGMAITAFIGIVINDGVTKYEFPKEEYKLEYRITTQSEISDTTYIISKIPD